MVIVAVVGMALAGGKVITRRFGLLARADYHMRNETLQTTKARKIEERARAAMEPENAAALRRDAAIHARVAKYHSQMSQKYRRAAAQPWQSEIPDPPEPWSEPLLYDRLP
jgi:hypothetical protein